MATFKYALNTSTIRECLSRAGEPLVLKQKIEITAAAGYDGIELWVRELDDHVRAGGSLSDVKGWLDAAGLEIVDLMGFFEWAVLDDERRKAGFEEAARNFAIAAELGCPFVAAPPFGIHNESDPTKRPDLKTIAHYFAELSSLAKKHDVTPLLEFWGISKQLGCLGEAICVGAESGVEDVRLLTDVFHIYKSSGHHNGMRLLDGKSLGLFHVNDYPANPPQASVVDAQRVMPGDGVAPLSAIFQTLKDTGFKGYLSLEIFNEAEWAKPAEDVAARGLRQMRSLAEAA
ncbi:MAG: sugar phosphate isomerase/epimerase [Opitutales bacterium]|nr:sugar phosphate isomerase/epimerase [Opitutales bacterium]